MSQVVFKSPSGFEIVGGYDALDREFFLYVFDPRPDANFKVLWSNLVDFDPIDQHSTSRLRQRLRVLKIEAPAGFWDLVELREAESVRHEWDGCAWRGGRFREARPSLREVPPMDLSF